MSRKPDPRPARTQALLRAALLELIQEKRWEKITVQDILDRTGVGRSTFYAHFDNKFELFTAGIPEIVLPISQADGEPDLLPLFEHVGAFGSVMLPLMNQPLLGEVMDTMHQRLADAWNTYLDNVGIAPERRVYAAELLAAGFLAIARRWLKNACQPDTAMMAGEFAQYAREIIKIAKAA